MRFLRSALMAGIDAKAPTDERRRRLRASYFSTCTANSADIHAAYCSIARRSSSLRRGSAHISPPMRNITANWRRAHDICAGMSEPFKWPCSAMQPIVYGRAAGKSRTDRAPVSYRRRRRQCRKRTPDAGIILRNAAYYRMTRATTVLALG